MNTVSALLALTLIATSFSPAMADSLIVRTRSTSVPVGNIHVVVPSVVSPAVPYSGSRFIRVDSVPTQLRTTSQPVLISPVHSNFEHRLSMLLDQIRLGENSGMIGPAQAAALREEHARLSSAVSTFPTPGVGDDGLEKQINLLNQRVSDSMK